MDIEKNIKKFIEGEGKNKGRGPGERYASFDYCFNYFQSFRERNIIKELSRSTHLQESCLQLAFYLASWGMLRGSSFLLEKSAKHFERLIYDMSRFDKRIWEIDVDKYTKENIELILDCKKLITESLRKGNSLSDTLVSKIMLGVFANTPAFDAFFRKGFRKLGIYRFNKTSLEHISNFYKDNKEVIDSYQINTLDFLSGRETNRKYTKAKIIDMIGFIEGQK